MYCCLTLNSKCLLLKFPLRGFHRHYGSLSMVCSLFLFIAQDPFKPTNDGWLFFNLSYLLVNG